MNPPSVGGPAAGDGPWPALRTYLAPGPDPGQSRWVPALHAAHQLLHE